MKKSITLLISLVSLHLMISAQSFTSVQLQTNQYPNYHFSYSNLYSIAFSPDGSTLATANEDGAVTLWDVKTKQLTHILRGHKLNVYDVAFSPDGQMLASGGQDKTVRLWDMNTKQLLHIYEDHEEDVFAIVFSPDGKILASASKDRTIRLWDIEKKEQNYIFVGHEDIVNTVAFSPDGRTLASGSHDHTVRLWDIDTKDFTHILSGHIHGVGSLAFSPDGKKLVSATDGSGASYSRRDPVIYLWDTYTGEQIQTISGYAPAFNRIAFSPDGNALVGATRGNTISFWDANTSRSLRKVLPGTTFAFSPDGHTLAVGDKYNNVRLYNLNVTRLSINPYTLMSPGVGEKFTISVDIAEGKNISAYQVNLRYDPTAIRYIKIEKGNFLPPDSLFIQPVLSEIEYPIDEAKYRMSFGGASPSKNFNGNGTLATLTFEVVNIKGSPLFLYDTLLTDSQNKNISHIAHGAIIEPSEFITNAVISITPSEVKSPPIGEQIVFNVNIKDGQDMVNFELLFDYDHSALKCIPTNQDDYLDEAVAIANGILGTLTFEIIALKTSTVDIFGYLINQDGLRYAPKFENARVTVPIFVFGDVNRDGDVNILDLVMVAAKFGQRANGDPEDVNKDSYINILDLVEVANRI